MSPFIETIKLQDGELKNLFYHQARFNRARLDMMGMDNQLLLSNAIKIPEKFRQGLFKCRVLYGEKIDQVAFASHQSLFIKTLKLVESESISYNHKFSDRIALSKLYNQRGDCDDILIVRRDCITDSYYANIALWDGNSWYTPDTPLLPGTMRASLLDNGILKESRIEKKDLKNFQKIRLINALNDLSGGTDIPVTGITW